MLSPERWTVSYYETNKKSCDSHLESEISIREIPLIRAANETYSTVGKLVRYIGMIQDVKNPSYYNDRCRVENTKTNETTYKSGKYRDTIPLEEFEELSVEDKCADGNKIEECQVFKCIPVPGLNEWTFQFLQGGCDGNYQFKKMKIDESTDCKFFDEMFVVAYDLPSDAFKVTNVVEAVGFLSVRDECDPDGECEFPRLHAILTRPLLSVFPKKSALESCEIGAIRHELHGELRRRLGLDDLAAEYAICYLLSRIFKRSPKDNLMLGKFSLNICNFPSAWGEKFHRSLASFVEKSGFLPLSLEYLNDERTVLAPKKDYETDTLSRGALQLPPRTKLVVDETGMKEGKLTENGARNLNYLKNVVQEQNLPYDYQFYHLFFDTDVAVLVLSEGKSILPCDFHVVLKADKDVEPDWDGENKNISDKLRLYLSILSSTADLGSISEDVKVADDYVKMRERDKNFGYNDLNSLLTLAQLMSFSSGFKTLDKATWEYAKKMQKECKERIESRPLK